MLRSRSILGLVQRVLLGTKHKGCTSGIVVRNASGITPEGYEKYYLEEEDHVQPLDNTVPLTPEKRAQLAAKYNLLPEDYVPMNDPSYNLGDYPVLPRESALERDPYYDWDDRFNRRNYGEPICWHAAMYHPFALDTSPLPYDRSQLWRVWLGIFASLTVLMLIGERYKSFVPRAPKQYPEEYPFDSFANMKFNETWDLFLERGLNPKLKERKQVVNYTFEAHQWDPKHMP